MIVKTLLAAILFLNAVSLVVAQQNTGALKAHHVQRTRVQHKSCLGQKIIPRNFGRGPVVQRPYALAFSVNAANVFNRTNKGLPVGNMSSPFFLKSPSGSNSFFFGPGGGSGGNRVISLRVRLSF